MLQNIHNWTRARIGKGRCQAERQAGRQGRCDQHSTAGPVDLLSAIKAAVAVVLTTINKFKSAHKQYRTPPEKA